MSWSTWRRRLTRVFGRRAFEHDLQAELAFHVAARADDLCRAGLERGEAERRARLEFGAQARYEEECREAAGWRPLDELVGDLRQGWRALRRDPGFTCVAVLVVAGVLSANLICLAFLDAYFLRPLPITGAERHVELSRREAQGPSHRSWPYDQARALQQAGAPDFDHAYLLAERHMTVALPEPTRVTVQIVSPEFFELWRPACRLGRVFGRESDAADATPSLVLSHAGWQRLAAGDPGVLDRVWLVDGRPFRVAGVLAPDARGLEPVTPHFWLPAASLPRTGPAAPNFRIGGVLRAEVSVAQALARLSVVQRTFEPEPGDARHDWELLAKFRPALLRERDELAPLALALLLALALVTLVAGANVTGLHLARAAARRRDLALRHTLGATRARLVRHLLAESLLLALAGGALACALTVLGVELAQRAVFSMAADAGLLPTPIDFGSRLAQVAVALTLIFSLACGLFPALDITRADLGPRLQRDGTALAGFSHPRRLRRALVISQVAFSVALLVAAGLLTRLAARAADVRLGYEADTLVDLRFDQPTPALLERLRREPGVVAASVVQQTPLTGQLPRLAARVDQQASRLGYNNIDERYFDTLGIQVQRGRNFGPDEVAAQAPRAIVSAATARRLWPGQDPLGRSLDVSLDDGSDAHWRTHEVIGVVDDVLSGFFFEGPDTTLVYLPGTVPALQNANVLVRVRVDNAATLAALRKVCSELAPQVSCEPYGLRGVLGQQRFPFSMAGQVSALLGALAMAFACLGLYGLMRFEVVQRMRELGVRLALGASRGRILREVLLEALRRVGLGLALGLPACLGLALLLAAHLPWLRLFDGVVYAGAAGALTAAALLAAYWPARSASAADPLIALRQD
jgi:predicted permease